MRALTLFWKWLTTTGTRKTGKAHPDLAPIDLDRLAHDLNLDEDAKRLGLAGLPSVDATTLSGPEAMVLQRVEKARQDYVDWAVLRLNVLSQELGRRNVTQEVNRAAQADKEFERKASAILSEQEGLLRSLSETAGRRSAEVNQFKSLNRLSRDAHVLTGAATFFRYALLLLLIVVEGVLNASFFAQGMDSGLLGGFSLAGILAATNVIVCFAFGKFAIRYLNHVNGALKALGAIGLGCALMAMASLGLGIAHYRDTLTAEMVEPAQSALRSFIASPLQLRDIFSWALFAISVGFGLTALFDGLFSDDLYPGYGKIARRALIARVEYDDELLALHKELEELKDFELKSLDETLKKSQASVAIFASTVDDKQTAGLRLSTALRDADNSLEALLSKFRTENQLHRNGVRPPDYFNEQPKLRPLQIPSFDIAEDNDTLGDQRTVVDKLLGDVQEIRARIQAAFNQQFDRLKPLDSHFPDGAAT